MWNEILTWMNEWMNDAFILHFIVYCRTPKALYNHVWGGGGGLSSTTTSAVHVDNVIFNQSNASLQNISILVTLNHNLTDNQTFKQILIWCLGNHAATIWQ